MKTLSEDSWFPGRDSNLSPPEYISIALPLDQPVQLAIICTTSCNIRNCSFLRINFMSFI
jgi:hypothetical protein